MNIYAKNVIRCKDIFLELFHIYSSNKFSLFNDFFLSLYPNFLIFYPFCAFPMRFCCLIFFCDSVANQFKKTKMDKK